MNFKANAEREENAMTSWRARGSYNDMANWFNFFASKHGIQPLDLIEIVEPDGEIEAGIRLA